MSYRPFDNTAIDFDVSPDSVQTDDIQDGAVTDAKIANVNASKLLVTAPLNANNQRIINVANPTAAGDAANKFYVDAAAAGLTYLPEVRVAANQNKTLSGNQTINGVALNTGDRILLLAQTNPVQNGIWLSAAGAWSRSADLANGASAAKKATFVTDGGNNKGHTYLCTNLAGSDVVGTNGLIWTLINATVQITPDGTTLTASGETWSVATGGINTTQLADGGVTTAKIANSAVADAKIANVATSKLLGTIGTTQITDGAVTNIKITDVAATKVTGTIATAQIADLAVTNAKINDVAATKVTGTIATTQIADGAVTTVKLAEAAVTNVKITDVAATKVTGTIATAQIADGAVTTAKLGDGSVTNANITDVAATKITGTLATAQIADGAVTTTKIADGAVTNAKVASGIDAAKLTGALTATDIVANNITQTGSGNAVTAAAKVNITNTTGYTPGTTGAPSATLPALRVAGGAQFEAAIVGYGQPNRLYSTGTGGGTTRMINRNSNNGEIALGFYRNADEALTTAGDNWVLGLTAWGSGDRNFAIGCHSTGRILSFTGSDGSVAFVPSGAINSSAGRFNITNTTGAGTQSGGAPSSSFPALRVAGGAQIETRLTTFGRPNRFYSTNPGFGGAEHRFINLNSNNEQVGHGFYRNADESASVSGDQWIYGLATWSIGDRNWAMGTNGPGRVMSIEGATGAFTFPVTGVTNTFAGQLAVTSSTASTNTTTGALVVTGGAGINGKVHIGGGLTLTGFTPSAAEDAATKAYVDSVAAGLTYINPVRVASTANVASISGLLTIDGVTLVANDRVLLKDQTTGTQNGVYVAAAGAWSRASDMAAATGAAKKTVLVTAGSVNANRTYSCTNAAGSDVVGTNALVFTLINASSNLQTDGTTLTTSSNIISIATSGVNTTQLANNAVTTAKITDANVTLAKLAANSVDSTKIVDGSVGSAEIADNAVATAKIADNAVTTAKIPDNGVTNAKIATGVDAAKLTGNASIGTLTLTGALTRNTTGAGTIIEENRISGLARWTTLLVDDATNPNYRLQSNLGAVSTLSAVDGSLTLSGDVNLSGTKAVKLAGNMQFEPITRSAFTLSSSTYTDMTDLTVGTNSSSPYYTAAAPTTQITLPIAGTYLITGTLGWGLSANGALDARLRYNSGIAVPGSEQSYNMGINASTGSFTAMVGTSSSVERIFIQMKQTSGNIPDVFLSFRITLLSGR